MDEAAFAAALEGLRQDRLEGASALARRGLEILAASASGMEARNPSELRQGLRARAERVQRARPSMAPLVRLVQRWSEGLTEVSGDDLAAARLGAAERAKALAGLSRQAVEQVADHTAAAIGPGKTLLTHSLSATVLGVFQRLAGQGVAAIVSESRPLNEGHRLAGLLSGLGVPTRLVTDAQIGLAIADADLVLVGADSLLPDGSLINKAGTYLLALAARERGVPFWVCCESFKQRDAGMPPLELERMDPAELGAPELPGVRIDNLYFDVTPVRFVTAWVDEQGVRRAADSASGPTPSSRSPLGEQGTAPRNAEALSDAEAERRLAQLNRGRAVPWEILGGRLHKAFVFGDFIEAFGFMSRVAQVAQTLDHHPDWCNSYRRVEVNLTTHEAQGLTERDFAVASRMESLVP